MKSFQIATFLVIVATVAGYPMPRAQTTVDPAYLRQYYAHLAQANQGAGEHASAEATPVYESSNQESSSHYSHPSQAPKASYASPTVRQYHQQQTQPQQQQFNSSYQFGFDVKDDEYTNYQNRKEIRDGGVIKGSYSVVDSDGFIRTVTYTADPKEGFKAEVVREPTDIVVKTPAPPHLSDHRHHNHQYSPSASYKQPTAQKTHYHFQIATFLVIVATVAGYPKPRAQTTVDPAYLRQYYAHLAQANQGAGEHASAEATPIYESSNQESSSHYSHPSQAASYASPTVRQYHQQQTQPQQQQFNSSYQFGFDVKDDEYTNYQNRKEIRDGGVIKGSYSVVDSDGFIRTVTYTADPKEGFKAEVVPSYKQPTAQKTHYQYE
uniref:Putative cyclin-dependent serine/threonine-protein kinase ddb g0272797/ddb g0274007 isoform x2 n=1 Tax=Lutzomyia longipalpis TaxID=7200 RepID=A0A1B0GJ05_LUTLO